MGRLKCFPCRNQHEPSQRGINLPFRAMQAVLCGWSAGHMLVGEDEGRLIDIPADSTQEIDGVSLECPPRIGHNFSIKRQQRATEGTQ